MEFTTTRAQWERQTADPSCAFCHDEPDNIGFGFENYDAVGLWREMENGYPINAAASTMVLGDFSGPEELIANIATSELTYACFANQWGQFSYARELDPTGDACLLAELSDAFETAGYDVKSLVLASTQTDAFRLLPAEEGTP
jgi:hypothetical protein